MDGLPIVSLGFRGGFTGGSYETVLLENGMILRKVKPTYSGKPIIKYLKTISPVEVREIEALFNDEIVQQEHMEPSNISNVITYRDHQWVFLEPPDYLEGIYERLKLLFT